MNLGHAKLTDVLETKNCSCKKCLFGKSVLAFEDEMLNTTETFTTISRHQH